VQIPIVISGILVKDKFGNFASVVSGFSNSTKLQYFPNNQKMSVMWRLQKVYTNSEMKMKSLNSLRMNTSNE